LPDEACTGDTPQSGEGCLALESLRVLAGGHEQNRRRVGADSLGPLQGRVNGCRELIEQLLELTRLSLEAPVAIRQGSQSQLGADDGVGEVPRWPQPRAALNALFGG
jgi:hypothetical protein